MAIIKYYKHAICVYVSTQRTHIGSDIRRKIMKIDWRLGSARFDTSSILIYRLEFVLQSLLIIYIFVRRCRDLSFLLCLCGLSMRIRCDLMLRRRQDSCEQMSIVIEFVCVPVFFKDFLIKNYIWKRYILYFKCILFFF